MKISNSINSRKMKVYDHHSLRQSGEYCTVPQIRLCGKWLKNAGFKQGDNIKIITMNNCLIIIPDEEKV